jgi:hypothetical protein
VLSVIFKVIAVVIWALSLFQIISLGSGVLGAQESGQSFLATIEAFMSVEGIFTACAGFVVGLVSYGIGEVIGLLNDIRGNTRL